MTSSDGAHWEEGLSIDHIKYSVESFSVLQLMAISLDVTKCVHNVKGRHFDTSVAITAASLLVMIDRESCRETERVT